MSEKYEELLKEIKELKARLDAVEPVVPQVKKLVEIEKEERQDLIEQAKKLTDTIPDSVIEKMTRCDLKQVIAKNTPAAVIPNSTDREDAIDPKVPFEPFIKKGQVPEGW